MYLSNKGEPSQDGSGSPSYFILRNLGINMLSLDIDI